jgi:hypothetical protein
VPRTTPETLRPASRRWPCPGGCCKGTRKSSRGNGSVPCRLGGRSIAIRQRPATRSGPSAGDVCFDGLRLTHGSADGRGQGQEKLDRFYRATDQWRRAGGADNLKLGRIALYGPKFRRLQSGSGVDIKAHAPFSLGAAFRMEQVAATKIQYNWSYLMCLLR